MISPDKPTFSLLEAFLNAAADTQLERKLKGWAQPPGQTEQEKCERAVRMVRQAIDSDPKLSQMKIKVFAKGSFRNRTNVPSDSDVDVGVVAENFFFNTYPSGMSQEDFAFVSSTYSFEEFRQDVSRAIQNKFGSENVTVGEKSIKVHANTVRVDADVVPHFIHRHYHPDKSFDEGVALKLSTGKIIYNWPDQDYDNGVYKNEADGTAKRFKALVRILKNLRSEMADAGIVSAKTAKSYFLFCLAYNIPDSHFSGGVYTATVENCLSYLHTSLRLNLSSSWTEVNELKFLFSECQAWTKSDALTFIADASNYFERIKREIGT